MHRYFKTWLGLWGIPSGYRTYRTERFLFDPTEMNLKNYLFTNVQYLVRTYVFWNFTLLLERTLVEHLNQWIKYTLHRVSVADPWCLSRIPDPTFFHPGSRIRTDSIPDPGSSSKNLSVLTQKNCFQALGNMIRVVHPGSRPPDSVFLLIPDPGSRGQKGTRSRNWIRNTAQNKA